LNANTFSSKLHSLRDTEEKWFLCHIESENARFDTVFFKFYNWFELRPVEPEKYICKIRVVILVSLIEEKFGSYRNRHAEMQAVNT
jgi:hypothetical protein